MKYLFNLKLLESFMDKHNLTREDFSILCKIDVSTINKIFEDNGDFSITDLFKIAKVLKIQVYKLFIKN